MSTDNKYQFKGTPGPWAIKKVFEKPFLVTDPIDGQEWYSLDSWIMSGKKKIGEANYSTAKGKMGKVDNVGEFEANAHLIAAAPDLLEFAVMMLQSIDGGGRVVTFQDHHIDELRAAIHKALNIEAEEA